MGADTKIQWADHTFNPWRGCQKIAPGCANCYADTQSKRNPGALGVWGPNGTRVVASEAMWREPLKWNRDAARASERPRVFCASLADVFEDWPGQCKVSNGAWCVKHRSWGKLTGYGSCALAGGNDAVRLDDVRARLFATIDETPNLDWLLLTKRPESIRRMWPVDDTQLECSDCLWKGDESQSCERIFLDDDDSWEWECPQCKEPCAHKPIDESVKRSSVWLGVSIACRADLRLLDELRRCRDLCAKTFVSAEPLLEDLGEIDLTGIDWVIVGGESGPNARPCSVAWIRPIVRQCRSAGVPCFVKQLGSHAIGSEAERYEMCGICIDARPGVDAVVRWNLRDPKGGNPSEWPEDLRAREVPT